MDTVADSVTSQAGQVREPVDELRAFLVDFVLAGRKTLRPAFVSWGYRAAVTALDRPPGIPPEARHALAELAAPCAEGEPR